ncbi:MAG: succinylglutamate desuccinylase/aspartoacylase family protein [Caldilineaceae bacterium]|nr:succinylglutamate desuccinylase/aspartoacylase family protein [Caldilineaceae bacterium]
MATSLQVGTAVAKPGSLQYGEWAAFEDAVGTREFLPVIIAQGREEGPCIWLTAGIHGPEHAGPAVLYHLLTPELADELRGTIVALPALCPPGLRTMAYVPYHVPENPNRLWPDGRESALQDPDKPAPSAQERAYARLYREMEASADYLIDYHNAWTNSLSFVFKDRILYRTDGKSAEEVAATRAEAEALAGQLAAMIEAYGHTVVNEFPVEKYIDEKLHRSTSGAALLVGGIPAFTAELSTGHLPDAAVVQAAVAGTRNVLRWAGMLDSPREPIDQITVIEPGYLVRRRQTPRVDRACVVLHTVETGDTVKAGDVVGLVRDVWGRPLGEGVIRAEEGGIVLGRAHGIYFNPGDPVLYMAIRDEDPMVGPYPEEFYKK